MNDSDALPQPHEPTALREPFPRGALGAWWWQGLRSALLFRPDWSGLQATPAIVVCLVLVVQLAGLGVERLYIDGTATFYWPALLAGWLGTAVTAWVCWLLVPHAAGEIGRAHV